MNRKDHDTKNCNCGCVPNIYSLHEMAEKRKQFLAEKKAREEAEKQNIKNVE